MLLKNLLQAANKVALLVFFSLSLNSCAMYKDSSQGKDDTDTKEVTKVLLATATSVERHLDELAARNRRRPHALLDTQALITPEGGLGGTADIDWTGPIAPLVGDLAKRTKYRMKILGREPAIPVIVNITQKKAVLADILKNAGMQAANRASIMVYPETRIIELRYHNP